jgi:hypothetical protein
MDQTSNPANGFLAVACGASLWVTRTVPTPIGIVVTTFLCASMIIDAWSQPN